MQGFVTSSLQSTQGFKLDLTSTVPCFSLVITTNLPSMSFFVCSKEILSMVLVGIATLGEFVSSTFCYVYENFGGLSYVLFNDSPSLAFHATIMNVLCYSTMCSHLYLSLHTYH